MPKKKLKIYADKCRGAKLPKLKVGDQVRVREQKWNRLVSKIEPNPFKIIAIKGTMSTACREEHEITWNCSVFKTLLGHLRDNNSESDDDSHVSGGEEVVLNDAPAAQDRPGAKPLENENNPAAQDKRERYEPVEDHLQGERRYPKR